MVCSVHLHLHMTVHGMGKCMRLSMIVRMMVCMDGGIGIGMACLLVSLSHAPFSLALSKQQSQYFLFFERALRFIFGWAFNVGIQMKSKRKGYLVPFKQSIGVYKQICSTQLRGVPPDLRQAWMNKNRSGGIL